MQPITFAPLLKRIRWGGNRLGTRLGKQIGNENDYAESWEIADQKNDQSIVTSGEFCGVTLSQLISDLGSRLLGKNYAGRQFPLLIKYLDANDWLSLQVHPNDLQAKQYDPSENGKTEAWVIMEAAPDSRICAGLRKGVTPDQLRQHLAAGTVESCLNMLSVKPGDFIYIPAGTVHAIGPGILLAEIQQQSNLTFRLFDWGRCGPDGKPRQLHVEESIACTDFTRGPVSPAASAGSRKDEDGPEELIRCPYFTIRRHRSRRPFQIDSDDRFRILMVLSGQGELRSDGHTCFLAAGNTILLPAARSASDIHPGELLTILEITAS